MVGPWKTANLARGKSARRCQMAGNQRAVAVWHWTSIFFIPRRVPARPHNRRQSVARFTFVRHRPCSASLTGDCRAQFETPPPGRPTFRARRRNFWDSIDRDGPQLPPIGARLAHSRAMTIREIESYAFRCPRLECRAEYVAVPRDQAPATKPRCEFCDTPFLLSSNGRFIHYQLVS
jgi:hypothetical protein